MGKYQTIFIFDKTKRTSQTRQSLINYYRFLTICMGCMFFGGIGMLFFANEGFFDFSVSGIFSIIESLTRGHIRPHGLSGVTNMLFSPITITCLLLYQLTSVFALAYTLKKVEFLNSCLKPEYRYPGKISTLFNITIITAFVSLLVEFVDLLIFGLLFLGLCVAMCVIGIKFWKKNIKAWESVEVLKKMAKTYYYYFIAIPILYVLCLFLSFTVSITAYTVVTYVLGLLLDLFLFAFLYDCMKVVIQQYDKEMRMQEIGQEDEEKQEEDNEEKEDENKEKEEEFINQESKNKCPNCNAEIPDDAKFCPECGYKIDSKINCPKCGTELQENEIFCPECGFRVR